MTSLPNEAGNTPGPWWTTDHGVRDRGGYIAHTTSPTRYEGQDERYEREVAERDANKRLIAASPDLLEALRGAQRMLNADAPACALEVIDAAIARATGSPQ